MRYGGHRKLVANQYQHQLYESKQLHSKVAVIFGTGGATPSQIRSIKLNDVPLLSSIAPLTKADFF
jgi:hypothetical protein